MVLSAPNLWCIHQVLAYARYLVRVALTLKLDDLILNLYFIIILGSWSKAIECIALMLFNLQDFSKD